MADFTRSDSVDKSAGMAFSKTTDFKLAGVSAPSQPKMHPQSIIAREPVVLQPVVHVHFLYALVTVMWTT